MLNKLDRRDKGLGWVSLGELIGMGLGLSVLYTK